MRTSFISPAVLATGFAFASGWASAASPLPLVTNGSIVVDSNDVGAYIQRIPEERRGDFLTSLERVTNVTEGIFIQRSFAAKAKAEGLGLDPVTQRRLQQAQEQILADAYSRKIASDIAKMDLKQRAREIYKGDPQQYTIEEQVGLQHIIIDYRGRTREMAMQHAKEAYEKAKAGEKFADLVQQYSDDPDKQKSKGDLGYAPPKRFVPQLREAVVKLVAKGDISPPIETDYGMHILRLYGRKPAQLLSFEAVEKDIITAEKERLQKERLNETIQEIKKSPTLAVHRENIEKLMIPIDPKVVSKAVEAQNAIAAEIAAEEAKK